MASEVGPAEQHVSLIHCRREGETCTIKNIILYIQLHCTITALLLVS